MTDQLRCLNHGPSCKGAVEYRMALSGTGRSFPRCDHHWSERLDAQEASADLRGDVPPAWFDPSYAGESWDGE